MRLLAAAFIALASAALAQSPGAAGGWSAQSRDLLQQIYQSPSAAALPAEIADVPTTRFDASTRARLLEAFQQAADPALAASERKEKARRAISNARYSNAIERGVLDRGLNSPLIIKPGDAIIYYRWTVPEPVVAALAGNPHKGGPCVNCIPNPATPAPGLGGNYNLKPVFVPLPSLGKDGIIVNPGDLLETREPGRRPEKGDPLGFMEVAALQLGELRCTGVLIHAEWILTAAHCVPPDGEKVEDKRARMRVAVPRFSEAAHAACVIYATLNKRYGVPCVAFDNPQVHDTYRHRDYRASTDDAPAVNDVALIRLAAPASAARIARLDPAQPLPGEITIAGYGVTRLPDRNADVLEIGWNQGDLWRKPDEAFLYDPADQRLSGACFGDSGGPLYRGRIFGHKDEVHQVVAVISAGRSNQSCSNKFWISATRISDQPVQRWICEKVAKTGVAGCG